MKPPPFSAASADAMATLVAEAMVAGRLPSREAPAALAWVLGALLARVAANGGGQVHALVGQMGQFVAAGAQAEDQRAALERCQPAGRA